jgi:hypothetical protein
MMQYLIIKKLVAVCSFTNKLSNMGTTILPADISYLLSPKIVLPAFGKGIWGKELFGRNGNGKHPWSCLEFHSGQPTKAIQCTTRDFADNRTTYQV